MIRSHRIVRSDRTFRLRPNQPGNAALDAVLDRYEQMMQRLIAGHASEFTEVGVTMAQAKVLYVVLAAAVTFG